MPIHYKVVGCTNPKGAEGVEYACNRATKSGTYSLKELAADVSHSTTVTEADVVAVISAYIYEIEQGILQGRTVTMQNFGSFRPSLKSKCFTVNAIHADGFRPQSYIKGYRVAFQPSADLKKYIRRYATLRRDPSELMS